MFLSGRAKDFLKLGGHRVSAAEMEEVLARQPGVKEVAVVGVTDDAGGERRWRSWCASDDAALDEQALRRACREKLPAFKVPKYVCSPSPAANRVREDREGRATGVDPP